MRKYIYILFVFVILLSFFLTSCDSTPNNDLNKVTTIDTVDNELILSDLLKEPNYNEYAIFGIDTNLIELLKILDEIVCVGGDRNAQIPDSTKYALLFIGRYKYFVPIGMEDQLKNILNILSKIEVENFNSFYDILYDSLLTRDDYHKTAFLPDYYKIPFLQDYVFKQAHDSFNEITFHAYLLLVKTVDGEVAEAYSPGQLWKQDAKDAMNNSLYFIFIKNIKKCLNYATTDENYAHHLKYLLAYLVELDDIKYFERNILQRYIDDKSDLTKEELDILYIMYSNMVNSYNREWYKEYVPIRIN